MMPEKIRCHICPHHCALAAGQTGICRARMNDDGKIVSVSYGRVTSLALDPVEKKPLARWQSGKFILSVGTFGCNLRCPFCQNHTIAQVGAESVTSPLTPLRLAEIAEELVPRGNVGVAFTYNEPLVGYEYVLETARLVRERGLLTALVTNGTAEHAIVERLLPYIDAMNIDLKGWTQDYYDWLGGDLETVKHTIETAAKNCHVEITTLVVPGKNDSVMEMDEEASWLASISPDLPLHISRFFPRFRVTELSPTPIETMKRLYAVAARHLKYVYLGNV